MPVRSLIVHCFSNPLLHILEIDRWNLKAIAEVIQDFRFAALLTLLLFLAACTPTSDHSVIELQGSTMGTTYSVKLVNLPPSISSTELQQKIDELLERINALMSTYRTDSELSRFNSNPATDWIPVSKELAKVVDEAVKTSERSDGAFDVTVGPLVNLWGFGPGKETKDLPSDAELAIVKKRVGYHKLDVRLDSPSLRKSVSNLNVDLSAIAKGYGVDEVAQLLDSLGIVNYLVEIGGEIHTSGHSNRGTPWRIAVETPNPGGRTVYRVVELRGGGMATSGDYRNFYVKEGKRYSHTIDPVTGRPVTHDLAAVTVLMPDTMRADAFATALMVLGPEAGFQLAEAQDVAAFFVIRKGEAFYDRATNLFKSYLKQERSND